MPISDGRCTGSAVLSRARAALIAPVLAVAAVAAFSAAPARAATAPAAGTNVYQETFEAGSGTPTILQGHYTGSASADNSTYTGSPNWATGSFCDGYVADANESAPAGTDNCFANTAYQWTIARGLNQAVGEFQGESATQALANNSLVDVTGTTTNAGAGIMLQTSGSPIAATTGHFYQVRADYAVGVYSTGQTLGADCDTADPEINLYLLGTSSPTQVTQDLDPCTLSGLKQYALDGYYQAAGEYDSPAVQWTGGSTMGLEQYDGQVNGTGDDIATDNLRVLDVSPTLSEAFASGAGYAGQPSTLTFTVTNTSELAAKDGWSFSQALPSGVTVAATPDESTTCAAGSVAATKGGSSIAVTGGDLAAGASSCTISVNVVPAKAGTYTASPSSATTTGLLTPAGAGSASLTAAAANNALTITQSASPQPYVAGSRLTYTVTVANGGPQAASGVTVSDPLPTALQAAGFTWTCTASAGGACRASGTGGVSDTATVAAAGTVTYTITGIVPASTTGPLLNTVTVTPSATTTDPGCSPSCSSGSSTAQSAAGSATVSTDAVQSGVPVTATGALTLPLQCSTAGSCTTDGVLAVTIGAGRKTKAHRLVVATFTAAQIAAGQTRPLVLQLSRATLRRLQALGVSTVVATLTITNHLAGGLTAVSSARITLRLPLACMRATGSVTAGGLGRFHLGLTTRRTRRLGRYHAVGHAYDRFCVTGGTVRVTYLTVKTLRRLHIARPTHLKGRIIIALTGNRHYAVHGVRARMSLKAARRRLHLGHGTRIGKNTWYVVVIKKGAYVLKVNHGRVTEIGVVNRVLARTSATRRYLLHHIH